METFGDHRLVPSTMLAGDGSVWARAHQFLFQGQLRQPVVVVDAACRFDPYALAGLARIAGRDPEAVLRRVGIMRVLTIYQLVEGLRRLRTLPAGTGVMVMGAHALFEDPELEPDEAAFYHARLRKAMAVYRQEAHPLALVERIRPAGGRRPTGRLPLLSRLAQTTTHCLWVKNHHTRSLPHGKDRTALFLGH